MKKSIRSQGFTLVEVLIASVIFFSAIVVATQAYSVSVIADAKARDVVSMLGPVPLIVQKIRTEIRDSPADSINGDGRLFDVDYRFDAAQVRFEPPPPRFDPDTAEFREYPNRFKFYDVRLTVSFGQSEKTFVYQEWAWLSPQGK